MPQRTVVPFVGVSWSEPRIRQHVAGALRHAMRKARATQPDVARWAKKSERSIREWAAGRGHADVFSLLRSGRIRREFLRYLVVCDRKDAA